MEARFAIALARLREKRGLTQQQLAQAAGLRQPMLARYERGHEVNAFNGFSIGKGHLADAKAAINDPRAATNGARAVMQPLEEPLEHNGSKGCGSGDQSQRGELLAKIKASKDA